MKIAAFTRVLYGADYLEYVVRSTQGFADQHIVLYTPTVSRGFNHTDLPCPDSRQDLYKQAHKAGPRLMWVEGEAPEVSSVLALRPEVDIVLELDADELIHPSLCEDIRRRFEAGELTAREYRLPFLHYWRSFHYACRDGNWPVRLYLPKNHNDRTDFWPDGDIHGAIHHFGYARQLIDMRYKMDVSVHRPEFRPGWWQDIFLKFPERLTDLHPVCTDGFWNAEPIDRAQLPPTLFNHPWLNREVIE